MRTVPWPSATCKKIGKDRACGCGDILADRQIDRPTHTQTYLSQYFATASAGEVIKLNSISIAYACKHGIVD